MSAMAIVGCTTLRMAVPAIAQGKAALLDVAADLVGEILDRAEAADRGKATSDRADGALEVDEGT